MSAALSQPSTGIRRPLLSRLRRLHQLHLVRLLRAAAEAGLPAPTNVELGEAIGVPGEIEVGKLMRELRDDGLIRVEFRNRVRIVSAGSGAWCTAMRATSLAEPSRPALPPRRCSGCPRHFVPATRFLFRCEPCREAGAQVAQ